MPDLPYEIERHEVPLPHDLTCELFTLWEGIFETAYEPMAGVLAAAEERDANVDLIFLAKDGGRVIATAHLTMSRSDPRIGGLGEVATVEAYRGQGLAHALCTAAAREFDHAGGQALFLGTGNPVAARVYGRVGWQYLPGSEVMLRAGASGSPQAFLSDYFGNGTDLEIEIVTGTCRQRVTMIPLIVVPHEWVVLDANTGLFSVRESTQRSCMSLYPRYQALGECGKWFAATRRDGAVMGLASVKEVGDNSLQIDAFAHAQSPLTLTADLFRRAIEFASSDSHATVQAVCAVRDRRKQEVLAKVALKPTGRRKLASGPDRPIEVEVFEKRGRESFS